MKRFESSAPWRNLPGPSLSVDQKRWLTKPGALTRSLREIGPLKLRVLAEYYSGATLDEARCLSIKILTPVWIREVVMSINGVECVVARSVTPLSASHGTWQGMRRLKSRPLADILYESVEIRRSKFEVARLNRRTPLYRTAFPIASAGQGPYFIHGRLLARRSVFWRRETPLLVAECFLPVFWQMV